MCMFVCVCAYVCVFCYMGYMEEIFQNAYSSVSILLLHILCTLQRCLVFVVSTQEVAMLYCTYPSIIYVCSLIFRATSLLEECGGLGSFSRMGDVKVRKVLERTLIERGCTHTRRRAIRHQVTYHTYLAI